MFCARRRSENTRGNWIKAIFPLSEIIWTRHRSSVMEVSDDAALFF